MKKTSLFLLLVLTACDSVPTQTEIANADYGSYPQGYEQLVKSTLEGHLVDPGSVQYRTITAPKKYWAIWGNDGGKHYGYSVCVTYNAKNRMGGYAGFSTEIFMIRDGKIINERDNIYDEILARAC